MTQYVRNFGSHPLPTRMHAHTYTHSLAHSYIFSFVVLDYIYVYIYMGGGASLVAQMVKTLPAVLETRVQSLGREDSLEKGMTTHSSILAWRIS